MANVTQSCATLQWLLVMYAFGSLAFILDTADIWNGSTLVESPYISGNTFVLNCVALVFLMSPGVGFLYSGLLSRKNALSALYLSMAAVAVVGIQVRSGNKSLKNSVNLIRLVVYHGLLLVLRRRG